MGAAELAIERAQGVDGRTEPGVSPSARALGGPRPLPPRVSGALELPARLLFELPLAPSLGLHVPGVEGVVRVSRAAEESEDDTSGPSLDAEEWVALVLGAEADRVWPRDLVGLLARKAADPSFRLIPEITLEGAQPDPEERWSLRRLLDRIGAELLSIEL